MSPLRHFFCDSTYCVPAAVFSAAHIFCSIRLSFFMNLNGCGTATSTCEERQGPGCWKLCAVLWKFVWRRSDMILWAVLTTVLSNTCSTCRRDICVLLWKHLWSKNLVKTHHKGIFNHRHEMCFGPGVGWSGGGSKIAQSRFNCGLNLLRCLSTLVQICSDLSNFVRLGLDLCESFPEFIWTCFNVVPVFWYA